MSRNRPTTACLINHFNYGAFVGDAVRGALQQTTPFDEILVVDDGSRAEDLNMVRKACAMDARVQLVEKPNGGQLSCFNVGFERSRADILFFLDADDFWDPDYLAAALSIYEHRADVSFVAAARRLCFADGTKKEERLVNRDLGFSVVRCHRHPHWVGAPTSCISARRSVLAKFLPFEAQSAWKTCADECLVYGTSIAGARKYEMGAMHVNYRVHGTNAWHGQRQGAADLLWRRLEGMRMCELLRQKLALPDDLAALAPLEFRTVQAPTARDFRHYREVIANSGMGATSKLGALFDLSMTYWFGRKRENPR